MMQCECLRNKRECNMCEKNENETGKTACKEDGKGGAREMIDCRKL